MCHMRRRIHVSYDMCHIFRPLFLFLSFLTDAFHMSLFVPRTFDTLCADFFFRT